MTSTMIISEDVRDLSEGELRSKFFQISNDLVLMEAKGNEIPMAKASLYVISNELTKRQIKRSMPRLG